MQQPYPPKSASASAPKRPPSKIYVRALGGDKTRGILQIGAARLPCALGRGGISAFKREGDGATPRGALRILGGFRQGAAADIRAQTKLKLRRARPQDGWCDAAEDRNYNRPVRLPYPASAETLRRADALYTIALILDWNICPRVRKRGSAVFFHIARPAREKGAAEGASRFAARGSSAAPLFHPTAGCIAVSPRAMHRLLPFLTAETEIITL